MIVNDHLSYIIYFSIYPHYFQQRQSLPGPSQIDRRQFVDQQQSLVSPAKDEPMVRSPYAAESHAHVLR